MQAKTLNPSMLKDKIGVVVGTRPGIIKFSPVIRALEKNKVNYFIAHTGQHYSYNMDKKNFEDLNLPQPKYWLKSVKYYKLHGSQTAEMIKGLEKAFIQEAPKIVMVGGDANTNLAGALAARKLRIRLAHLEAGLRSHDWRMPEEHNRVIIDHISEYLLAPTKIAKQNLIKDNVKGQIKVVGNTIVDAVWQNLKLAQNKSNILDQLNLKPQQYFLLTAHREENVDSKKILANILKAADKLSQKYHWPIIFPIHPRTKKRLQEFKLQKQARTTSGLRLIEPLGYLDFLLLLAQVKLVLTDSGGIQEEACILCLPCVTLRTSTERPETVKLKANLVAGLEAQRIVAAVSKMLGRKKDWPNPFGDGKAGQRIAVFLQQKLKQKNY